MMPKGLTLSVLVYFHLAAYDFDNFVLFDLMLYVHDKQLRSCLDGQLLNHTVPGHVPWRQFTSIKCPFFYQ